MRYEEGGCKPFIQGLYNVVVEVEEAKHFKPCPFCGEKLFREISEKETKPYKHPNNGCILRRISVKENELDEWNSRIYEKRLIDIGVYAKNILTVKDELMKN